MTFHVFLQAPVSVLIAFANLICIAVLLSNKKFRNLNFVLVISGSAVELLFSGCVAAVIYASSAIRNLGYTCFYPPEQVYQGLTAK